MVEGGKAIELFECATFGRLAEFKTIFGSLI